MKDKDAKDELLSAIFESAMDGIFVVDLEGRYKDVNPAGCAMFGYTREEFLASDISLLLFPEDLATAKERVKAPGEGVPYPEYRMRKKDGSEVWIYITIQPLVVNGERLKLGIKRDITEMRRAALALRAAKEGLEEKVKRRTAELKGANRSLELQMLKRVAAEELLHTILKATSSVAGEEFLRTLVRQLAVALGVRYAFVAELSGGSSARTLAFWSRGRFGDNFEYKLAGSPCEQVMGTREPCVFPRGVQASFPKDECFVQMEVESYIGIPITGEKGVPVGVLVAMDDKPVAAAEEANALMRLFALRAGLELRRKRAEDERKKSMDMLNAISDHAGAAIYVKDADGRYLFVNRMSQLLVGREAGEILGRTDHELFPGEVADIFLENDRTALDSGSAFSVEDSLVFEGQRRTFLTVKIPIPDTPGMICGVSTDITDRKRAEEQLRRSEEQLREAQAIAHVGSWEWEIPANALHWSDEIYRIFGLKPQEFGATYEAFLSAVHPDDLDSVQLAVRKAFEGDRPYEISHRIVRPDGSERIVSEMAVVTKDASGKPLRMAGTVQDVTEHKKMEAELLKAQKLDSIGVLAGGIAHDFNNLLLGVLGNVSIAKNYIRRGDKVASILDDIEKAALRTKGLTQQLLTFSRGGEPVKEPVLMEQLVGDASGLVLRDSSVLCEQSFPEGLWPVDADQGQLSQAVNNIILNAMQSMPDGGTIKVSAENIDVSEASPLPIRPGRYVRTTFRDFGAGIAPKLLPRIFDPFFTTRKKASGLGLAVTYSIIKKHKGHICVDSKVGGGTSVHMYLPVSDAAPAGYYAEVEIGSGRVLVMDDEELIRDVSGEMLKMLGYEAVFSRDGAEAVALYKEAMAEGRPFDAVVLDLTVTSGMGGKEAIRLLKQADPGVKAIVSSGYSRDPIMAEYSKHGFKGVIAKPYRVAEFSRVIKSAVEADRK